MVHRTFACIALTVSLALAACTTTTGHLERGLSLYEAGRYDAAIAAFDAASAESPQNAAAWSNRGAARMRIDDHMGALADFTTAVELAPTDADLYFNRANAYMALGNYDYALQDLTRATALKPTHARAFFNRGTARYRLGDRAGAEADWRYAMAHETDRNARQAMVRTAQLSTGTTAVVSVPVTDVAPSAMPALGLSAGPSEAEALALRGVNRALAGDRQGAAGDLREAAMRETRPEQRGVIERLLRAVEGVQ